MSDSNRRVCRIRSIVIIIWIVLWTLGVGSLFAQTDTEREAERLIRDMQIDVMAPEPNITMPSIYTDPPMISTCGRTKQDLMRDIQKKAAGKP